jgi:hypothetical protein
MEHQFDELAKALAGGLSRREALRLVSGGLVGAALTLLCLGKAYGFSCVDNCIDAFDRTGVCVGPTPPSPRALRAQCEAACRECGGDNGPICRANANTSAVICCPGRVNCSCVCGG